MKLPPEIEIIDYRCNICGEKNRLESSRFHRELALCSMCGSNARFRGIIHVLGGLIGYDGYECLRKWPRQRKITGLGMSDWPRYAGLLAEKFRYENTFYDRDPRLDIQQPAMEQQRKYDFVISSDVFEHILPPLQQGFDNLRLLLKPGGVLVFSVPTTHGSKTVEHYPNLHEYEILPFQGRKILVNRTRAGILETYDNPVFHGGEGATLEMRLFCEADVVARLGEAGFENIVVHDRPWLPAGFYWPELPSADPAVPFYAYIISARRPFSHPPEMS